MGFSYIIPSPPRPPRENPPSEAVSEPQRGIGVPPELPDKVRRLAANPCITRRRAPVLAVGLRKLPTRKRPAAAHRRLHRQAAVRIDGPGGVSHERFRKTLLRLELQRISRARPRLARVSAGEGPLLPLPLELDHIKRELIRIRRGGAEVRALAFQREPAQRRRRGGSVKPQLRIGPLNSSGVRGRIEFGLKQRQRVESIEINQRKFVAGSDVIPARPELRSAGIARAQVLD